MKNYLAVMVILLTSQLYSQAILLRVLLDDGTASFFPVDQITKVTFESDACDGVNTVTYSGKEYTTLQIGTKCWLTQNLNVGTYITDDNNQTDNSLIEKHCAYDVESYCDSLYGGLYQWAEAVAYTNGATNIAAPSPVFFGNIQGICPTGWHIPSYAELQALLTAVGNSSNALKAIGQGTGLGAGTNTSGFSALLAGFSISGGSGDPYGYFWSNQSSGNNSSWSYYMYLTDDSDIAGFDDYDKTRGKSIRCVKD